MARLPRLAGPARMHAKTCRAIHAAEVQVLVYIETDSMVGPPRRNAGWLGGLAGRTGWPAALPCRNISRALYSGIPGSPGLPACQCSLPACQPRQAQFKCTQHTVPKQPCLLPAATSF